MLSGLKTAVLDRRLFRMLTTRVMPSSANKPTFSIFRRSASVVVYHHQARNFSSSTRTSKYLPSQRMPDLIKRRNRWVANKLATVGHKSETSSISHSVRSESTPSSHMYLLTQTPMSMSITCLTQPMLRSAVNSHSCSSPSHHPQSSMSRIKTTRTSCSRKYRLRM